MGNRPEPGYKAPEGTEFVAMPNNNWRLAQGAKLCRRIVSKHTYCRQSAVAEINRGYRNRDAWWGYCKDHLYGNWIEDGKVMHWIVRLAPAPADNGPPWTAAALGSILTAVVYQRFTDASSNRFTFSSNGRDETYELLDPPDDSDFGDQLVFRRMADGKRFEVEFWVNVAEVATRD